MKGGRAILLAGVLGVCVLLLLLAPFFAGGYWMRVLTTVFMFAVLAESWNIVAGYCGHPSFGNVVFFGIGAYTTCVFMVKLGLPFYVGILAGTLLATGYCILLGFPILRLKGHYFAVATLGVAEATKELVSNLGEITKGSEGISLPLIPGDVETIYMVFYYIMFAIMALTVLTTFFISKNRIGYAFRAIRSDEEAASTQGINTTRYKIIAWALSAFFTALVGGIYAYWTAFIDPEGVFSVNITVKMIIMCLLGGPGTVLGPIIGAFVFEILSEFIWGAFIYAHASFLGILIILIVIFMPGGFMNVLKERLSLATLFKNIQVNRV
jgi:branched-chain amino acid transport system permease protein